VAGAGLYIVELAPNFFENWREKRLADGIISNEEKYINDPFFKELCELKDFKFDLINGLQRKDVGVIEAPILEAIAESINILTAKDPAKLPVFKHLIAHIAAVTANSIDDISPTEQQALDKINQALNAPDSFGDLSALTHPFGS
jgi:F0F1-type ATP synthase alpha subunit